MPLTELISIALEDLEEGDAKTKEGIKEAAAAVISAKRLMMSDYFSLDIDEEGNLCAIPCLLGKKDCFMLGALSNVIEV